jgi:hypothetical protein
MLKMETGSEERWSHNNRLDRFSWARNNKHLITLTHIGEVAYADA